MIEVRERQLPRDGDGIGFVHAEPGGLREEKAQQRARGEYGDDHRARVKFPAGK